MYMPRFISVVVIVSIYKQLLAFGTNGIGDGVINQIIRFFGGESIYFLGEAKRFWGLFTLMNMWASIGWGSILYVSAISGLGPEQYEACKIDGGGRFRMMWNVTLPGIRNTIVVMFILRVGNILSVGLEPVLLLSNPLLYETSEVLSLHVYLRGIGAQMGFNDYSYASAVGVFQSVVGLIMVVGTNLISRRVSDVGLW